jgi:16S rRNA C967 or C1407 C5-methylase (RsmB/RsmF family)
VYSTCSLSNLENDGVVAKAMKKFNKAASSGGRGGRREEDDDDDGGDDDSEMVVYPLDESNMPFGEKTEFGWHILPDRAEGWGPIYLCAFDKVFKS